MNAEQSLREGRLDATLSALTDDVRKAPQDPRLRVFMFQLLAVLGQWERAVKQLQVGASLDEGSVPMAQTYRELLGCELFRAEVFAGRRPASVLGATPPWLATLLEALALTGRGEHERAEALRAEALDQAPATPGALDDKPFAWLADSDSRLGPVLEVMVQGRYYLLPMAHVAALRFEPPSDLRDLVWAPAKLTLLGGRDCIAFVPARYPGSEAGDDAVRLARTTQWTQHGNATYVGLGQRQFTTDQDEVPMLDVRRLSFDAPAGDPGHA